MKQLSRERPFTTREPASPFKKLRLWVAGSFSLCTPMKS